MRTNLINNEIALSSEFMEKEIAYINSSLLELKRKEYVSICFLFNLSGIFSHKNMDLVPIKMQIREKMAAFQLGGITEMSPRWQSVSNHQAGRNYLSSLKTGVNNSSSRLLCIQ